ncbi:hypothetical protein [Chryseobacterium sp. 6424]|uniref:hypothetical protein n=1 Tax=Chryseobacterium sp. 6424 TaxID=2039166 RepID=UPI0013CEEB39|nr:hypothetical protein [Chryseobacterium sp. 6424]
MKKIILSSIFALAGLMLNAQQSPALQQKNQAQMEQKRAEKLKMMQADLQLSDAQTARIKAMQDKRMEERRRNAPQIQAERKARLDAMKAQQQQWDTEMKQILTPAQYDKWQAQQKEKSQARKTGMKAHRMKKMPAAN